jgi:hypothetical protein
MSALIARKDMLAAAATAAAAAAADSLMDKANLKQKATALTTWLSMRWMC